MKPNPYNALKRTILTNMILVPFIPYALVLVIGGYYFSASIEDTTIDNMNRIVGDHRQMIESFLMERRSDLGFIINTFPFDELIRPEKIEQTFINLRKKSQAFVDLGIFDENGLHVTYIGPHQLSGKDYNQAPWFQAVLEKDFFVSDVFLGYRRVPHFIIAVAKEHQGHRWIIRATIDSHVFNNLVNAVRIGETGEAFLLDTGGVFQTNRRSGGMLMHQDPDHDKYGTVHEGIRTLIAADARGEKFLYATAWLKDNGWQLVVRQRKTDAFKAMHRASYIITLTSIAGGAVIVTLAFLISGHIIRRLETMDQEKNQLGEHLFRAGRLAEIGEMAAGFAHEINNPLQIIKSEHALIKMILSDLKNKGRLKQSDDVKELEDSIAQIHHQVDRCADITQAILKFGRKTEPISQNIELPVFIADVVRMVNKKAAINGIAIKQQIADDLPVVHGDPSYLQQVLVNLLNNAIDATVARHGAAGGEIRIESAPLENLHIEIRVSDNGTGISTENMNKVFTPFFTTKPVGQGTGLGLSLCYGIIQKMGGSLSVTSQEGVGTSFTVRLPLARQRAQAYSNRGDCHEKNKNIAG